MPGSGIAAAWEISSRLPGTNVVMLSVSGADREVFAALRAGAVGYLLKTIDPDRLPQALWDVNRGEAAIPGALMARIIAEFRDRGPRWRTAVVRESEARLSSREWEVLELLRCRLTTAQIANRLSLTPATVRSHRARILRKLRTANDDELVSLLERE